MARLCAGLMGILQRSKVSLAPVMSMPGEKDVAKAESPHGGAADSSQGGRYRKAGAGPGSLMAAYAATAKVSALTSTRIFVSFAPCGLLKDFAFGVVFFT